MRRWKRLVFMILGGVFLLAGLVVAQEDGAAATAPAINWFEIAALAINTVGVTLGVQLLKAFLPKVPGSVKAVLTVVAGPLLLWAQIALAGVFGFPIDFSSLIEILGAGGLTSVAAMVPFMVGERHGRNT